MMDGLAGPIDEFGLRTMGDLSVKSPSEPGLSPRALLKRRAGPQERNRNESREDESPKA